MNIIEIINNYLKEEGISQHHIAGKSGITDISISYLLNFNSKMYYNKFLKVLDAIHFKIINEKGDEMVFSPEDIIPHIMYYMRKHHLKQNALAAKIKISNGAMCQFFGFQRYMSYNKFIQVILLTGFKILGRDGNTVLGTDIEQDVKDHFLYVNDPADEEVAEE